MEPRGGKHTGHPKMVLLRARGTRPSLTWTLLLSLALLLAGACGDDTGDGADQPQAIERSPSTPVVIAADEPVVVGVSSALTGPIGPRGSEYRDAVITSVERWKAANGDTIAGHEIEVHAEDDGCSEPGVAAIAAQRLLSDPGLVGVIGPQCSGGAQQAIPLYADAGVVAISGSATRTDLTTGQAEDGFFFRTAFRNDLEGGFIGLFFTDTLTVDLVYFVDAGDAFSVDLANSAEAATEQTGDVEVVRATIQPGQPEAIRSVVDAIMADAPGFVGFGGFNPEATLLYRQLRDAGYTGGFGAGDAAASQRNFIEPLGEASEGALFSGCQYPLPDDFISVYTDIRGVPPSETFPGQYADATTVLLDAVQEVAVAHDDGSLVIEPTALRDAVRAASIDGLTGPINFDSHGDRVPEAGQELDEVQATAFAALDAEIFTDVGLIPCQVQDGQVVPLGGPDPGEICCLPEDILPPQNASSRTR